jgi:hypothetical protein
MLTWNPYISEVKNGFIKSVSYVTDYNIVQSILSGASLCVKNDSSNF